MGNMFKKSLNVYDAWFGFYGDFKKGTLWLPYGKCRRKWVRTITRKHFYPLTTDGLQKNIA